MAQAVGQRHARRHVDLTALPLTVKRELGMASVVSRRRRRASARARSACRQARGDKRRSHGCRRADRRPRTRRARPRRSVASSTARPFSTCFPPSCRSGRLAAPITPICASLRAAGPVLVVEHGNRAQREIAAPPREFLEAPAPAARPGRQAHLGDDLVGLKRGRQRARGRNPRPRPRALRPCRRSRSPRRRRPRCPASRPRDRHARGFRPPCRGCGSDNARHARSPAEQRMRRAQVLAVEDVAPAHLGAERTPSLPISMRSRPSSLRRSTSSDGVARRNAIIGIRLCPPAITLASP